MEPNSAMVKGSALHTMVLEPDEFEKRYLIAPDIRRGTNAWKEIEENAKGREILKQNEYKEIARMAQSVFENKEALHILENAHTFEKHLKWDFNGLPFHGFADIIGCDSVIDVKTTQDVSPREFTRFVFKFKYHWQAALYLKATGLKTFKFIGLESKPPYNVMVYELAPEVIDKALNELVVVTNAFKKWDGLPQSYSVESSLINLPPWM